MTEADEIARNMIARAEEKPAPRTMDEARAWVKVQWPDWHDWIGHVMLDNLAESILKGVPRE